MKAFANPIFNTEKLKEMFEASKASFQGIANDPYMAYVFGIIDGARELGKPENSNKFRSRLVEIDGQLTEMIDVSALMAANSKIMFGTIVNTVNSVLIEENAKLKAQLDAMTKKVEPSIQTKEELAETVTNDTDLQPKKKRTRKKKE